MSHSRPLLGCFEGTLRPSLRHILSTRLWFTLQPSALSRAVILPEHFEMRDRFPHNVSPLAFLEYDEEEILEKIKAYGWEKPDDTDPNSTNCQLNSLGIDVHRERFGFHPYAFELAGLVRAGYMKRDEAIERLEEDTDARLVKAVRRRLEKGTEKAAASTDKSQS